MKYVCQILHKYKRKIKIHLIHEKSKDAIQLPNFFNIIPNLYMLESYWY
mgnify:CR=1 FL=1